MRGYLLQKFTGSDEIKSNLVKHGIGKQFWNDGTLYDGEWWNDYMHGVG
tara:strand:+ start:57 stop:203 length:147 start_codon:yes stop_codon:yes gene_type:complete